MREKIAEILADWDGQDWGALAECDELTSLEPSRNVYREVAGQVLEAFHEEIEKIENHQFGERWDGFEVCRQKILSLLR